jgi:hypothetical protein
MGDDGDDGYTPDIKLKGTSDVLDQVDKDTEEVLDFSYVPGNMEPGGGGGSGNQDPDSVDGVKGEHDLDDLDNYDDEIDHASAINQQDRSGGEWGEQKNIVTKVDFWQQQLFL